MSDHLEHVGQTVGNFVLPKPPWSEPLLVSIPPRRWLEKRLAQVFGLRYHTDFFSIEKPKCLMGSVYFEDRRNSYLLPI